MPLPCRGQVQIPETLVAPLALSGEADDQVGGDDQAVPLPPARVPLALPRHRDADHRLGQQQEARDGRRRQQLAVVAEDGPVARGADPVDDRPDDRDPADQAPPRGFTVRPAQRRQVGNRPDEPHSHRDQHRRTEQRSVTNQPRRDPGTRVDEGRSRGEHGAHQQPHRNGDLEAGVLLREEDAGRPVGVEAQEAAGRHERQREEQDACISSPIGRLARRVAENECHGAHGPEDDEVGLVVLEVRIELRPKQQRDEADHRQRGSNEPGRDDRRRPRALPKRGQTPTHMLPARWLANANRHIGHVFSVGGGPRLGIGCEDDPASSSRTIFRTAE